MSMSQSEIRLLERRLAKAERELAEAQRDAERLDWIGRHLIEGKWDGTIGRPKSWVMRGPYRHKLQAMSGDTLREAIDAATAHETLEMGERDNLETGAARKTAPRKHVSEHPYDPTLTGG